eukprot:15350669-Ditylum_brightwellii.AAC.1
MKEIVQSKVSRARKNENNSADLISEMTWSSASTGTASTQSTTTASTGSSRGKDSRASTVSTAVESDVRDRKYEELRKNNAALKAAMKEILHSKVTKLKKNEDFSQDMLSKSVKDACRSVISNDEASSWSSDSSRTRGLYSST